MGFLDSINNIKDAALDRLQGAPGGVSGRDTYFDDYDDEYDDAPYEDDYNEGAGDAYGRHDRAYRDNSYSAPSDGSLLGNTSRPAANSVAVYTRSGQRVAANSYEATANADNYRSDSTYQSEGAYRVADDAWRSSTDAPREFTPAPVSSPTPSVVSDTYASSAASTVPPMTQPGVFGATGNTPADRGLSAVPRATSGKLPPYVLKPKSYDDVQTVVRRVRTNQPVVLNFKALKIETAKRILDFSFGLACGVDGSVEELGDRIFVVLPQGVELTDADKRKLRIEGLAVK